MIARLSLLVEFNISVLKSFPKLKGSPWWLSEFKAGPLLHGGSNLSGLYLDKGRRKSAHRGCGSSIYEPLLTPQLYLLDVSVVAEPVQKFSLCRQIYKQFNQLLDKELCLREQGEVGFSICWWVALAILVCAKLFWHVY